jgi:hypothetical protein
LQQKSSIAQSPSKSIDFHFSLAEYWSVVKNRPYSKIQKNWQKGGQQAANSGGADPAASNLL